MLKRLNAFCLLLSLFAMTLCATAKDAPPREGLKLWLDASDAATLELDSDPAVTGLGETLVSRWANKAADGRGFVQTGNQRPCYLARENEALRPALRFDGRNDVLLDEAFNLHVQTWTLIAVVVPYEPAAGGAICSATTSGGHDYDPGFTVDLFNSGANFESISVEGAGRIDGQKDQMQCVRPYGEPVVVTIERDEREIRLLIDGVADGIRPAKPATTLMDTLRIGSRFFGGSERFYFHGEIAELMLYDRILDPAERAALEASRVASAEEKAAGRAISEGLKAEAERNRMHAPVIVKDWPSVAAYLANADVEKGQATTQDELLALPIRTDINEAIVLAAKSLTQHFNWSETWEAPLNISKDYEAKPMAAGRFPTMYWGAHFFANGFGEMGPASRRHPLEMGVSHAVGRNMWASMLAEETIGLELPDEPYRILRQYMHDMFDNEDHLGSFYQSDNGFARAVICHDLREGFLGLLGMMRSRDDAWARETARLMVRTLDKVTDENGHLSSEKAREAGVEDRLWGAGNDATTSGRLVGPLVMYYQFTGDELALDLAGRFAWAVLKSTFTEEGSFKPCGESGGHVHSITSTLAGVTRYAVFVKDESMIDWCQRIVDHGIPEYFSSWGWGDEVMPCHSANEISRGEMNQTGDVIRAALLLGESVDARYYDMAERYLRDMLLPTQLHEEDARKFMKDNPAPEGDWQSNIIERVVGGWSMQLPNDRMQEGSWPLTTQDIISGAMHALCACWDERTVDDGAVCRMNLMFDFENEAIALRSALPVVGRIEFSLKQAREVRVRVPEWVDRKTLAVTVNGQPIEASVESSYVVFNQMKPGDKGLLTFDVPCKVERETVDGVAYTTTWIGNQVIEILPRGSVSPFPF